MSKGSSKEKLKSDVKKLVTKEIEQSKVSFLSHKELIEQSKDFVVIYNQSVQAKSFIKEGFDYRTTLENMKKFTRMREMATDGVSNNRDKLQTSRNLTTTTILLHEILKKTNNIMSNVLAYHRDLGRLQFKLDSLVNNSTIYKVPADSAALKSYLQKNYFLKSNLDPVNASIVTALDSIQQLEVQVDIFRLNLESDLALTESTRENMVSHYWTDEISKLDKKTLAEQTFNANLKYSLFKAILVFMFYTYNHAEKFGIMLISFIFVLIYLQLLLKRCIKTNVFDKLSGYTEILKYPIASSLLLTITVMQFFLPDPPIVFDALIWIISSLLFSYILWKTVDRFWFKVWLIYILLFAMTLFDNLILRYSHPEQNFMFVISTISIIVGSYLLIRIKHQKITEKAMVIPLAIMLVFELIALYFNFTRSYNMAKTTMSNGIFIFVLVYILLWCARLVMEAMNISIYFQKNMNDETHQIPVDIFTKKIPISLHLLLVLAAIFLTYRTSYTFQSIIDPIIAAYSATRSIGKFSFTYESVFIFFFVMYLSSIISKIVSFLTAGSALYSKNKKDSGPGSWLLLIKKEL